jgi:hypothetical protein
MMEWWHSLEPLTQFFYGGAAVFSVIFLWQFITAMLGIGGGHLDLDAAGFHPGDMGGTTDLHADSDGIETHSAGEAGESVVAFHILSVRAILAFLTLFFWAAALYRSSGKAISNSLVLAAAWGAAAWLLVAVLLHWMRKLAETGTAQLSTCVGKRGTVYLTIPAGGQGEVRVTVSGVVSVVRARGAGGATIAPGTAVKVTRVVESGTVEVQPVDPTQEEPGETA